MSMLNNGKVKKLFKAKTTMFKKALAQHKMSPSLLFLRHCASGGWGVERGDTFSAGKVLNEC